MIVIAIVIIIAGFSYFVGLDYYQSFAFRVERNLLVSTLGKARAKALSNFNQKPHGVHIESGAYTIFEGNTYVSGNPSNQIIDGNSHLSLTGSPVLPVDIVFSQLTANANQVTLTLADAVRSTIITINPVGQINW